MYLIQVSQMAKPCQVDFVGDVERSCKGALHFVPRSTKQVTDDELAYIKANHKDLAKCIAVVSRFGTKKAVQKGAKRPKDNVSKTKLRAKALLDAAKSPKKEQVVKTSEPPNSNESSYDVVQESKKGTNKNKKK